MWRSQRNSRSSRQTLSAVVGLAVLILVSCSHTQPSPEPATLVLVGGKIVTVDSEMATAEALAIRDQTILAVGSDQEIRALITPSTRVIELDGAIVIPGFIEGHAHFFGVGKARMALDLRVESWDEIVELVAAAVAEAGPDEWILGRGWHQEKWQSRPSPAVDGLPLHDSLSAVSPANPVMLTHASGHAVFANARAMELAGVTATTPDPPGGEIVRDPSGAAIGVFRENAEQLIEQAHSSGFNEATARRQAQLAGEECLSKGITSFHDAGVSFAGVDLYRKLAAEGVLDVRLWVMLSAPNDQLAARAASYRLTDEGNGFLTVGGIKRLFDGALGSHGAWLLAPYSDLPTSSGLNTLSIEDLTTTARIAIASDLQLAVHAIGDRANREVLDVYQKVFAEHPEKQGLRWRIEHAQHLDPDDIPRFASLGVVASMQPVHCTSDGPWVPQRLGEERSQAGAYVWRKLIKAGAVISAGTDAPVEDLDPIANFYAAVTRRLADGSTFFPEQSMTRAEALRALTYSAAHAAFQETVKGSLEVGKLADVTVLSADIMSIPEDEILATRVLYTIIDGTVRYESEPNPTPR